MSAVQAVHREIKSLPLVEKNSPAMSISTVVVLPSALVEHEARKRRVTSSNTRFSSPARSFELDVGWMGGWALSFLRPLRGR